MSILQCADECYFIDQTAARAIDDANTSFRFCESFRVEKMPRLVGERRVKRDEIGVGEQIVNFFDQLDLQAAGPRGGEIGIVSDYAHAERDRAPAKLTSNSAHADHAERFAVKLDTFKIFPAPFFRAQARISLWNF